MQTTSADSDFFLFDGDADLSKLIPQPEFPDPRFHICEDNLGNGIESGVEAALLEAEETGQQGDLLELEQLADLKEKGIIPNDLPIAVILPEARLMNLQEPRQYLVPEKLVNQLQLGMMVRVRLAGKLINGWVISILPPQPVTKRLGQVEKIVGRIALLRPEIYQFCQIAAEFYCGSLVSILKRAIPTRHARVEKEFLKERPDFLEQIATFHLDSQVANPLATELSVLRSGNEAIGGEEASDEAGYIESPPVCKANSVGQAQNNQQNKKVYRLIPEPGFKIAVKQLKDLVFAGLQEYNFASWAASGAAEDLEKCLPTAVLLFPELRTAKQFYQWLCTELPENIQTQIAFYHGSLSIEERYKIFLKALAGEIRLVVGLRSAVFLPLPNLKRIVIWDDGSDHYREDNQPYWHTREIAQIRAYLAGAEYTLAGFTVSVPGAALCDDGGSLGKWLGDTAVAEFIDCQTELVSSVTSMMADQYYYQQIPSRVMQKIGEALQVGPVLVQVPHRTQVQTWGCARCGERQYCPACKAVLQVVRTATKHYWQCGHCRLERPPQCLYCGSKQIRTYNRGLAFTMRNLKANFRGVPLVESRAGFSIPKVNTDPQIVVATPGVEPVCASGYALVVVADADLLLSFDQPWTGSEALRRWVNVAALAKPGAPVLILGAIGRELAKVAESGQIFSWAKKQYHERVELGFPPAGRLFSVLADKMTLRRFLYELQWPATDLLGPISTSGGEEKALLRIPCLEGRAPLDRAVSEGEPFLRRIRVDEAKDLVERLYRLRLKAIAGKWGKIQVVADPDDF